MSNAVKSSYKKDGASATANANARPFVSYQPKARVVAEIKEGSEPSYLQAFSKEKRDIFLISGQIALLEILRDQSYEMALKFAEKEQKPFLKSYEHANLEKINSDLQVLYNKITTLTAP